MTPAVTDIAKVVAVQTASRFGRGTKRLAIAPAEKETIPDAML
jgi:hypothetical protein